MTSLATDSLPDWYPFANARVDEIDGWLIAAHPPYEQMRDALPWLRSEDELGAWLAAAREAKVDLIDREQLLKLLPGIEKIPMPPRRQHFGG